MKHYCTILAFSLSASLFLTACSDNTPPQQIPAYQPSVQQQQPAIIQDNDDHSDAVLAAAAGAAAGYMVGNSSSHKSSHYQRPTTVVHKTVIINKTVNKKPYKYSSSKPYRSYSKR
jgi:hypothetical protein